MKIEFTIPMRTVSESNLSGENWRKKSARHKKQKQFVKIFCKASNVNEALLPCTVKMHRIAPRSFDYDNLVSSFKWIRDAISEELITGLAIGRADDDKRITWEYIQEKGNPGQYAIRIEIESDNN
jgi:hypothetical protein